MPAPLLLRGSTVNVAAGSAAALPPAAVAATTAQTGPCCSRGASPGCALPPGLPPSRASPRRRRSNIFCSHQRHEAGCDLEQQLLGRQFAGGRGAVGPRVQSLGSRQQQVCCRRCPMRPGCSSRCAASSRRPGRGRRRRRPPPGLTTPAAAPPWPASPGLLRRVHGAFCRLINERLPVELRRRSKNALLLI